MSDSHITNTSSQDMGDLHDGLLIGIRLMSDDLAVLEITSLAGEAVDLHLEGLQRMRAMDFLEGNIILDVSVYRGGSITPELVAALLDSSVDSEGTRAVMGCCEDESLEMLELSSSYGCALIALCERVHRVAGAGRGPEK